MAKGRKAPSAAQLAQRERFAAMARARAGKAGRAIGGSASVGRASGGGMMGGMIGSALGGGIDALWIIGGKVVSRAVPALLKLDASTPAKTAMVAGVQLGAGLGMSWAAGKFLSRDAGRLLFAGAVVGVLETAARKYEVPYISTLVGDEGDVLGGFTYEVLPGGDAVGLYPGGGPGTGMGLYPGANAGMGSYVLE